MKRGASTVLAILGLLSLCRASTGALVVNSGNLHASATAFNNPNGATDSPPDKPLVLPATSISADAVAFGMYGSTSGHADATVGQSSDGVISIDANTSISNKVLGSFVSTAETSGTISFTETGTETVQGLLNGDVLFAETVVNLSDSSNNIVLSVGGLKERPLSASDSAALTPGNYTISWSLTAEPNTEAGGPSFIHFALVPEPAGAGQVVVTVSLLSYLMSRH